MSLNMLSRQARYLLSIWKLNNLLRNRLLIFIKIEIQEIYSNMKDLDRPKISNMKELNHIKAIR
jgi:hypothetical protein